MRIFFYEHVCVLLPFFCFIENGSLCPTCSGYYNVPSMSRSYINSNNSTGPNVLLVYTMSQNRVKLNNSSLVYIAEDHLFTLLKITCLHCQRSLVYIAEDHLLTLLKITCLHC